MKNGEKLSIIVRAVSFIWRLLMAFRPPTFNVPFHAWRKNGQGGSYASPDVAGLCNLSPGKRVELAVNPGTPFNLFAVAIEVMMPALTDIRGQWNGNTSDVIEAPAGSKIFWTVMDVFDTAKGFGNEYRTALCAKQLNGNANLVGANTFPVPMP